MENFFTQIYETNGWGYNPTNKYGSSGGGSEVQHNKEYVEYVDNYKNEVKKIIKLKEYEEEQERIRIKQEHEEEQERIRIKQEHEERLKNDPDYAEEYFNQQIEYDGDNDYFMIY